MSDNPKPLGKKVYGSIPHLPSSRLGPSDKQANPGHVRIATEKRRDRKDLIILNEKLDGSNVGVTKLRDGSIVPLTRSGYEATSSPYSQHQYWAVWVWEHSERFDNLLVRGEWCVGEWCIQAHGTRYIFEKEPFFLFDLFRKEKRILWNELCHRNSALKLPFPMPEVYRYGDVIPVAEALSCFEKQPLGRHGAIDPIEGYVWRVEREGEVDFLVKYVRPDKNDGLYLPEISGDKPVYNYWGETAGCIEHLRDKELLNDRRPSSEHTKRPASLGEKQHIIKRRSNNRHGQSTGMV